MKRTTTVAVVALAVSALTLTGCVAGSSSSKLSGTHIGHNTIGQIEPGVTNKAWVLATLGEPSSKSSLDSADGGTEIWRYEWTHRRKASGWVFPIVVGSSNAETSGKAYVEFEGDTVVRAWRDVTPYRDDDDDDDCADDDDSAQVIIGDDVQVRESELQDG